MKTYHFTIETDDKLSDVRDYLNNRWSNVQITPTADTS
jgi:hypothetical protein